MFDMLIAWDHRAFHLINGTWHHPLLDLLFPFVTDPTHFTPLLTAAALTLLVWGNGRVRRFVCLAGLGLLVSDAVSTYLFKYTFLRVRPCTMLEGVRLLTGCTVSPSFPSNHAVNVSTLATLMALSVRLLWVPVAATALLVAYSRVYVGVHYPIDVLAGCLLGIAIALLLSHGMSFLLRRFQGWAVRVRPASSVGVPGP